MPTTEEPKQCLECQRTIKGRVDKKFCDDACRNSYNNRLKADDNNYVRNVTSILKKNRRLLAAVIKEGEDMGKCTRHSLANGGFDFGYHTHTYTNKKGQVYTFCYEYGALPLEGDWMLVVKRSVDSLTR